MRIASKTGTPVFSADRLALTQWRASCAQTSRDFQAGREGELRRYHVKNELAKCNMRPVKWYAMMVGLPHTRTWDKVIVVLAERNWNTLTDIVDTPGDVGSSVAAEVGLALANALYATSSRSSGQAISSMPKTER